MKLTTTTGSSLKANSTYLIIHQAGHADKYTLWTQHQSHKSGVKMMRALGRNVAMGHYKLMERAEALKILGA